MSSSFYELVPQDKVKEEKHYDVNREQNGVFVVFIREVVENG